MTASDRVRYRIDLAFHGAQFHGWQRQPGLRTVQGELEMWLSRLLPDHDPVTLTGAGRTDAGVHAEHMVAHFDSHSIIDPAQLTLRLQAALPDDISVLGLVPVTGDFHARFSAVARTYVYRICTCPNPFGRDRAWRIPPAFSLEIAQDAASRILGGHDFSGFCLAASQRESMTCLVRESRWEQIEDGYAYQVTANRFLHGMVRLLVGTMADISRGRWPAQRMEEILERKDVRLCGMAAPPHGLTLVQIEYPDSVVPRPD